MKDYYILDVRNLSQEQVLIAASLQGLVNRHSPTIFLLHRDEDLIWTNWYKRYGYEGININFNEMISQFKRAISGAVIYDTSIIDTAGIAVSISGLMNLIILEPALIDEYRKLGIPIKVDLTERWDSRLEAYKWAYEELWGKCVKDKLMSLPIRKSQITNHKPQTNPKLQISNTQSQISNPSGEQSRTIKSQIETPLIDYAVCHKVFTCTLPVNEIDYPQEAELWRKIMNEAQPEALMLGWHQMEDVEATYVDAASQAGLVQICSSGGTNLSFHQHIKSKTTLYQSHYSTEDVVLKNKVYITFSVSDGDALHSMTNFQQKNWLSTLRGSCPVSWWIAPSLKTIIAPSILEYYYLTKTENDYLVCGPSGAGYNYLSVYKNPENFLKLTASAMESTDTKIIWAINRVVKRIAGNKIIHKTCAGDAEIPLSPLSFPHGWESVLDEAIKNKYGADYVDTEVAKLYAQNLPDAIGFFQGFEPPGGSQSFLATQSPIPNPQSQYSNIPIFQHSNSQSATYNLQSGAKPWSPTLIMSDSVSQTLSEIDAIKHKSKLPCFIPIVLNMCGPMVNQMFEKLTEIVFSLEQKGYLVVRPDEFLLALQKYLISTHHS